jgi:DNA-binding CsgD family transcriptional regulator
VSALEELGLSDLEESVYLAVLDRPRSSPDDLAGVCGASRPKVNHALANLQELGLVTRLAGAPAVYLPVRPDLAVGVLLRQREERLGQVRVVLGELTERFQASTRADSPDELIEVIRSPEAIHQRWLQLQRSARTEVRVLDKPPYIDAGNPAEPDLLGTGVRYRTVYDRAALDHPGKLAGIWEAAAAGENSRIAPAVPIKLFIADDRMALAPLHRPQDLASAVIVHPSALLDALSALFEGVWQRAMPLAGFQADQALDDDVPVNDRQRRLLQLLAGGGTDESIARQLDVGYRTVQRQISTLMEQFGVHTRFQLGLRAAELVNGADR